MMSDEDRYVEFVGSLELFNQMAFAPDLMTHLIEPLLPWNPGRYSLGIFLKYFKEVYFYYEIDLLQPRIILGVEKQQVFLQINAGPKLEGIPEGVVGIYSEQFNLKPNQKQFYEIIFNEKNYRLEFLKTNLLPMLHRK